MFDHHLLPLLAQVLALLNKWVRFPGKQEDNPMYRAPTQHVATQNNQSIGTQINTTNHVHVGVLYVINVEATKQVPMGPQFDMARNGKLPMGKVDVIDPAKRKRN
jgi:hypothetical protein